MKKLLVLLLLLMQVLPAHAATTKVIVDTVTAQDMAAKSFDTTVDNAMKYDSFALAIAGQGSNSRTLLIPSSETVSANIVVPATTTLRFHGAGQLSVASGVTVTIVGDIQADPRKIFTLADSTSKIRFTGNKRLAHVYPQWWGATGDGATDDRANLQLAIDAVGFSGGGVVHLPPGNYVIGSTPATATYALFLDTDNTTLEGEKGQSTISATSGNPILIGGISKGSEVTSRTITNASQTWYTDAILQSTGAGTRGHPTSYSLKASPTVIARGDEILPLQTVGDAAAFAVGDWIFIRTGNTTQLNTNTEPDAEINQVTAVDLVGGILTLRWPLSKPYAQEYFSTNCPIVPPLNAPYGVTSTTPTACLAEFSVAKVTDRTVHNITIKDLIFTGPASSTMIQGGQLEGLTITNTVFTEGKAFTSFGDYRRATCTNNKVHQGTLAANYICPGATGTTDVIVSNNHLDGLGTVHIHEGTANYVFSNNIVEGSSADSGAGVISLSNRGYGIVISNNSLVIRAEGANAAGIVVQAVLSSGDGVVEGNHISCEGNCGSSGQAISLLASPAWVVKDNVVSNMLITTATAVGGVNTNPKFTENDWDESVQPLFIPATQWVISAPITGPVTGPTSLIVNFSYVWTLDDTLVECLVADVMIPSWWNTILGRVEFAPALNGTGAFKWYYEIREEQPGSNINTINTLGRRGVTEVVAAPSQYIWISSPVPFNATNTLDTTIGSERLLNLYFCRDGINAADTLAGDVYFKGLYLYPAKIKGRSPTSN